MGKEFVVTVNHGNAPDVREVRRRMEGDPELLRRLMCNCSDQESSEVA